MPAVLRFGRYTVYIYDERGERHHEPHCHVHSPDSRASVSLRSLLILDGRLATAALAVLADHLDELVAAWERLNPEERP